VPPSAISWGKASIKQWRNEGKTHRRRLASNALLGSPVGAGFLGARPKVWLSDRLPAQCTHTEAHQFCLAHLIRDARYAIDHGDMIFAPQLKAFLKDARAVGCRRPDLADRRIGAHRRRLDRKLGRLLDLKPTDVEGSHLRATVAVTASDKLLVFLARGDVEATNNKSERALRPSVIFRRVTNGFRSEWGRQRLRRPCSVAATGRLAGRSALAAIRDALAAPAPEQTAA
jgi:transposase